MALLKNARKLILAAGLLTCGAAVAEDIDLYQGGPTVTGNMPNVLIIIDNSANWSAANQGWPGGIKQGDSELNALALMAGTLNGAGVKVGLMEFTSNNPVDGGFVRYALRTMDSTNVPALQSLLAGIRTNGVNSPSEKTNSASTSYGSAMYEAYKYFSGSTTYAGMDSKRDYAGNGSPNVSPYTAGNLAGNALASAGSNQYQSPLDPTLPCSKNFIIFIGNGFPSTSSPNPTTLGDATLSGFNATQIYPEGTKTTYMDEWARYLHDKGAVAPCASGVCADSTVTTYTIDVYLNAQDMAETALLKSAASVGGGKYFAATSESAIVVALQQIFNEIQAVNSVFTSASLPVSVNTQGTYLNQIYMGVFRPDPQGRPRWLGNLKEFKFGTTTDALGNPSIFLADADGVAAVNNQTGFITPSARSFWSSCPSGASPPCPSSDVGFWAFNPQGIGGQYDAPDGDLVEKGAAAQRLRDTLKVSGVSTRNVYTFDPAWISGALLSTYKFDTSNTAVVNALSGTGSTVSLSRAGPTVTATSASDLLLGATDIVTISGASVAAYNGTWSVTRVDATHFTFGIVETPTTPATSVTGMIVSSGTSVSQSVPASGVNFCTTSGGCLVNGVNVPINSVYVNLPSHGFNTSQPVTIAGANVSASMATANTKCTSWPATTSCEYNGAFGTGGIGPFTVIDSNNFWYTPPTGSFGSNQTPAGTTTTYNPPDGTIAPGSSTVVCHYTGSPASDTVANASITKATQSSATTMRFKVVLSSLPAHCGTQLQLGGSGNNNRITAITVTGTGTSLDGVAQTITGIGASCTAATTTAAAGDRTVCFIAAVTSATTTLYSTTTIIPVSPAIGTITATGIPTRTVSSITRTAGNASNVATVTVTTATPHLFGGQTSVTVSGADQTVYNNFNAATGLNVPITTGTTPSFVGGAWSLDVTSDPGKIFYNITTGPAASASGNAAKGSSVDASTLINWVRGVDNKEDENANGSLTDVRASIHGDVLHSRPIVINYGGSTGIVAFYGSNDGTLHAVLAGQDPTDGTEKWSFVAPEHYSTLNRLYANSPVIAFPNTSTSITPTPTRRNYFWDGNIGVFQSADLLATHIFVSMRRGGRTIYALDVSNPDTPKFLWKKSSTDTGFSELGQTWSEPKVFRLMKTAGVACLAGDPTTFTRALIFGAGYDPTQEDLPSGTRRTPTMGRGVFVLNAVDGSLIKLIQPGNDHLGNGNSAKLYSFPAEVTLLDTNGDGCVDRVYAVDTGANIFRIDIGDPNPANWKTYKLASLGDIEDDGGSNDRKFEFAPGTVIGFIGSTQVVYVMAGSGDREQPLSTAIADRFSMVKDTIAAGTPMTTTTAIPLSQLTQICDTCAANFNASTTNLDVTDPTVLGWTIQFDTGEKSVNAPLTVAGTTFFGTNLPTPWSFATNQCKPNLGIARGYAIDFFTGTSAVGDRNGNGVINKSDLYANFVGGGLPPSPVSGVVQIDASTTVPFIIGSGGSGTSGSTIQGYPTPPIPGGKRNRVFWYFKKDQ